MNENNESTYGKKKSQNTSNMNEIFQKKKHGTTFHRSDNPKQTENKSPPEKKKEITQKSEGQDLSRQVIGH